eukprot:c22580_g1_i1 orf=27-1505(+)
MAMALEEETEITVHALLLSFPARTHLNPLIQLAKKLTGAAAGTCKFVFTSIISYQAAGEGWGGEAEGGGEDGQPAFTLRTIAVPDGLPSSNPRVQMLDLIQACDNMKAPTLRFLPHLLQSSPPLSLIISDVFVPWAPNLAASFRLPLFSFFTSNATSCCVMTHAPSLLDRKIIPFQESNQHELITCPGAPPLHHKDFPVSMQLQDVSHPQLQYLLKMGSHLDQAAGLIINTCYELETDAIKVLQARCPVYAVGPLFLPIGGDQASPDQQKAVYTGSPTNDCLAFLDAQAPGSVLYVSFGTFAAFSKEQIEELALGLENSQQPFLWVVNKKMFDSTLSDVLPDGFLERMKDRCLVTSWAPQLQVLKHGSVGGFFSHCGWNSILENITLSGAPMLCWPDKAEQGVNARLLVDVWKLGLPFKSGKDCNVSQGEVEAAVKRLMEGEEGQEMRRRGAELKRQVANGVKQGGSSLTNLGALVMTMRNKSQNAVSQGIS